MIRDQTMKLYVVELTMVVDVLVGVLLYSSFL